MKIFLLLLISILEACEQDVKNFKNYLYSKKTDNIDI